MVALLGPTLVLPGGHFAELGRHILEKLRITAFQDYYQKKKKKDAPKFRDWKKMKSD